MCVGGVVGAVVPRRGIAPGGPLAGAAPPGRKPARADGVDPCFLLAANAAPPAASATAATAASPSLLCLDLIMPSSSPPSLRAAFGSLHGVFTATAYVALSRR